MKRLDGAGLLTPVYLRTEPGDTMPECTDDVFYVLSRDGLSIGRNVSIGPARFRSVVPAKRPPAELERQSPMIMIDYPRLPAEIMGVVLAFFRRVAADDGAEAIVLLVVNAETDAIELIVPEQRTVVGVTWSGSTYPVSVAYDLPRDLPPHRRVVGDIHSHVYEAAYASATDVHDERHAPGLHVVVGRVDEDPPQYSIDFVVDGHRFDLEAADVLAAPNEQAARAFPAEWLDRVHVERRGAGSGSYGSSSSSWSSGAVTWSARPPHRNGGAP